jgi:hypothetical protein
MTLSGDSLRKQIPSSSRSTRTRHSSAASHAASTFWAWISNLVRPWPPSAVSLARKTEKIARLYEQGASQERIGRYETHWARWLRSLTDRSDPAAPAPQGRPPLRPTPRLCVDLSGPLSPFAIVAAGSPKHK